MTHANIYDEGACCWKPYWPYCGNWHDDDASGKKNEASDRQEWSANGSPDCAMLDEIITKEGKAERLSLPFM